MAAFRILLGVLFGAVVIYTIPVVANHGMGLLAVFVGDIARMGWPGQFNLDFLGFLTLSAFWLAWRHQFSPAGLALGVLGFFGGIPVLSLYLLLVSLRVHGDVAAMLLGEERAAMLRSKNPTPSGG
jgi:hypothetical protein